MSFDFNLAALIPTIMAALLGAIVYRLNRGQDAREARIDRLESRLQAIELSMARDMPDKEDMASVSRRLDKLDGLMQEVRDMVIRMDERGKQHSQE